MFRSGCTFSTHPHCSRAQSLLDDTADERFLAVGVCFSVEFVFLSEAAFELSVFRCDLRVLSEAISKRKTLHPEWALEGNEVEMMRPSPRRWLAEPVHEVWPMREIDIPVFAQHSDGVAGSIQALDASHDIDDRFRSQAGYCSTSDMLDGTDKPRLQELMQRNLFFPEAVWPLVVVGDDLNWLIEMPCHDDQVDITFSRSLHDLVAETGVQSTIATFCRQMEFGDAHRQGESFHSLHQCVPETSPAGLSAHKDVAEPESQLRKLFPQLVLLEHGHTDHLGILDCSDLHGEFVSMELPSKVAGESFSGAARFGRTPCVKPPARNLRNGAWVIQQVLEFGLHDGFKSEYHGYARLGTVPCRKPTGEATACAPNPMRGSPPRVAATRI